MSDNPDIHALLLRRIRELNEQLGHYILESLTFAELTRRHEARIAQLEGIIQQHEASKRSCMGTPPERAYLSSIGWMSDL